MSLPNYPSPEIKAFGEAIMMSLYDSDIQRSMGGLGGCKSFDINNFPEEHRPYILAYIEGNLDSLAIAYAAMRTKEILA